MKKLAAFFLALNCLYLDAQVNSWQKTDTIPGRNDYLFSIVQMPDSGFLMCGWSAAPPTNYDDNLILRVNANGDTISTQIFGTAANDETFAVIHRYDGGYLAAGNNKLYWLNPQGLLDSTHAYTFSINETTDIIQTPDSGYIITGGYGGYPSHDDVAIQKVNKYGDSLWFKLYGSTKGDIARKIISTSDGNYLVVGSANWTVWNDGPSCAPSAYILKVNGNGDTLWTDSIPNSILPSGIAFDVIENRAGNYLVCGTPGFLASYSPTGQQNWMHTYPGANLRTIAQRCDGNYLVGGEGYMILAVVDSIGDTLSTILPPPNISKSIRRIIPAMDNGFAFTGYIGPTWNTNDPYYGKTDALGGFANMPVISASFTDTLIGNSVVFQNTSGNSNFWFWDFGDGNFSSAQNPSHAYTQAGTYWVCLTAGNDCDTSMYCDSVVVQLVDFIADANPGFGLLVYPQPVIANSFIVNYSLPENAEVTIELMDASGRRIAVPVEEAKRNSGINTETISAADLSNGIYLLRISAGGKSSTVKIVK